MSSNYDMLQTPDFLLLLFFVNLLLPWRKRERHQPGMGLDSGGSAVYPSALTTNHPPPPFGSGSPYELQNTLSGTGTPNGLDNAPMQNLPSAIAPTLANTIGNTIGTVGSTATHSNPSSNHSHANSPIVTLPNVGGGGGGGNPYGAPDYFGSR